MQLLGTKVTMTLC